jgi:hypothetical protein
MWKAGDQRPRCPLRCGPRVSPGLAHAHDFAPGAGAGDNTIRVFNEVAAGEGAAPRLRLAAQRRQAHPTDVNSVRWHPRDASLLASAGDDGTVRLWRLPPAAEAANGDGGACATAVAPAAGQPGAPAAGASCEQAEPAHGGALPGAPGGARPAAPGAVAQWASGEAHATDPPG